MMNAKTRPHFLTESGLKPEDFRPIGYFSMVLPDGVFPTGEERELKNLVNASPIASQGVCSHCGAHLNHHVVYQHVPSGDHIVVGEQCAFIRLDLSNEGFADFTRLKKQRKQVGKTFAAFLGFTKIEDNLKAACILRFGLRESFQKHLEENCSQDFLDLALPKEAFGSFSWSLSNALSSWGNLTDRQMSFVFSTTDRDRESYARKLEREEESKSVPALSEDLSTFEGEIMHTKWQDSIYGGSLKMIVKNDLGQKLWGTVPSKLSDECGSELVGTRIRFSFSKLSISSDDRSFGFYSRPKKVKVL